MDRSKADILIQTYITFNYLGKCVGFLLFLINFYICVLFLLEGGGMKRNFFKIICLKTVSHKHEIT